MKLKIKFSTVNIIFLIYTTHIGCYEQLKILTKKGIISDNLFYHENAHTLSLTGLFVFYNAGKPDYWYRMSDKYEKLKRKYGTNN